MPQTVNMGQSTVTTPAFTDKDMLHDVLANEKDIAKTYASYIIETNCPKLRTILMNNFKALCEDQYTVFQNMSSRGWYPTEQAPVQKLNEAKTKFNGIKTQMK